MQYVATTNPEAYDFYLRGRNYMYSMARRDYEHAIRMFEQAIGLDPKYALAYAGLADAYSHHVPLRRGHAGERREGQPRQRAGGRAGSATRPKRTPRAAWRCSSASATTRPRHEFETAIARNPNLFEAWYYYGLACLVAGPDREGRASSTRKASEVNPADFQVPMFLAMAYCVARPQAGRDARAPGRAGHARAPPQAQSARHPRASISPRRTCTASARRTRPSRWPSRPCSRA